MDYDATYALIWGRDLAHGHAPDYSVPLRPAGHPLLLMATTLLAPLGRDAAAEALRWLALLGAGAMVAALWRLARSLGAVPHPPVCQTCFRGTPTSQVLGTPTSQVCQTSTRGTAALAAVLLATRAPLWGFALLGFMDQWAAAFVLWAAALEVRQARRGGPVFVLLALAGLIRPESWLFAAAYWAWCAIGDRRRALRLLPLAALAPLVWLAWDLVTTGTRFGSLTPDPNVPTVSTAGIGVSHAPEAIVRFLGGFTRPAEAIACVAGVGLAIWARDRRMLMPAALIALNVIAFVLVAIDRGPLEQRYLLVAAACALLFAAYAIAQIAGAEAPAPEAPRPDGPAPDGPAPDASTPDASTPDASTPDASTPDAPRPGRAPLRIAAAALAVACLVLAPLDVRRIGHLRDQVATASAVDSQLRDLVLSPAGRCAIRGRVRVPDIRLRPFIAYWGGGSPKRIGTSAAPNSVVPADPVARELVSRSLPRHPGAVGSPAWIVDGPCARQ